VDPLIVKGNVEVAVGLLEPVDLVITHAVVFRQDDLDVVAAQFELVAEPEYHIAESAHFCYRGAFGRYHDDEHFSSFRRASSAFGATHDANGLTCRQEMSFRPSRPSPLYHGGLLNARPAVRGCGMAREWYDGNKEADVKILLATDGSECSEGAARFLTCLRLTPEDEITIFHAVSWVPFLYSRESYIESLKEIRKEIAPKILDASLDILKTTGAKLSTAIVDGAAHHYIVDAAVKSGMDLIAMGARGIKGAESIFVGSVTKSVSISSPVPVLVTRLPVCGRGGKMKILFATDGSDYSVGAGKMLMKAPFPSDAELTLLTVIWPDLSDIPERFVMEVNDRIKEAVAETRSEELREAERITEEARELFAPKFSDIRVMTKIGDPPAEILNVAGEIQADIIAVGCRGLRGIKGMMGSVSRNILAHAKCTVLIGKECAA
jgi:nucleotide-binding universal stress UspA family protein